jgi:hypothetical protein
MSSKKQESKAVKNASRVAVNREFKDLVVA